MMLPMVSASLVHTARIRDNPYGRARRTAASDQVALLANGAHRREEMQRLVRLHRDIKGVTPEGIRYSGLNPEAWNWNLISIFFMHRGAFIALTGEQLDDTGDQAVWDRYRALTADLQMPGRTRELPTSYPQLCAYYDHVAAEKLTHTEALDIVMAATLHPRRPAHMPAITAPLYSLLGPIFGHIAVILGFGIMHPRVRALVPMPWTRRHDIEFLVFSRVLRGAYRRLPRRITETPLARNRRQYERIVARYQGVGLVSFVPGATQTCGR
ncbi:DUF2236 domain-containing protein [Mycobacterium avium]|nr:DUF2236 domain-containing protein [Mycobacterium avium]